MSKRIVLICVALVFSGMIVSSCSEKEEKPIQINKGIAARVMGVKITNKRVDDEMKKLTPSQLREFKGEEGRLKFIDKMIEEYLLYAAAKDAKIDQDEEAREIIENSRRRIMIGQYYQKNIINEIEVTDEEIEEYYNANQDEFKGRPVMKAQHIFTKDRAKADALKKRLDEGEVFSKLAKEESEDTTTAWDYGNLGYFNPGSYIKYIGVSKMWSDAVEKLEAGVISDVIPFEKGYSIVRVNERNPTIIKPLSEARNGISSRIRSSKSESAYIDHINELKKRYKPENYERDRFYERLKTPEQMWERAQLESDPYVRVQLYRDLVNRYPGDDYAPQALFMIGFVYAEELEMGTDALHTFEELLRDYPDSEIAKSAEWFIENIDKPHPKFESIDNFQKMMDEEQENK